MLCLVAKAGKQEAFIILIIEKANMIKFGKKLA